MTAREVINSPTELLVSFFNANTPSGSLVLLSGPSGAGKTTWILSLLDSARQAGIVAAGVVSPGVYAGGEKAAIDLLDAASGQRVRLAERRQTQERVAEGQVCTWDWAFLPVALESGNRLFSNMGACSLLVVDELGPVEFDLGQGFSSAFEVIDRGEYRLAVVVIRPALLERACRRWPRAKVWTLGPEGERLAER